MRRETPHGQKAAKKKAPAKKKSAVRKSAKKAAPAPAKAVKVTAVAGKTVTASALLQAIADHMGIKKSEAKTMVEGYTDVVKAYVLKGAKVKIGDIGMIMVRARKARMAATRKRVSR
ncbi:MAG: HU family DNA-binding protein [Caulobacteraceae bacterium]|nr:HU family DNA-binding protein [Caulobacteraceae bacterium]